MKTSKSHRSYLNLFTIFFLLGLAFPGRHASAQAASVLPGQFVYVENGTQLYLVRGDVEEPILLLQVEGPQEIGFPHFSRDGRYLAYCLIVPGTNALPAIHYFDTLTLERQQITGDGSCSYDWSPDGSTLIYSTPPAMEEPSSMADGLWSYSRLTGEIQLLLPSDVPVIDPRWSPDGHTLSYFDFCFECVGQFHTYDLNTGSVTTWAQEDPDQAIGPEVSWSPDGKALAYDQVLWMYSGEGETHGLSLASSDGKTRKEIYSEPGRGLFFPLWSPDGKSIGFASFESFIIGNYVNRRGDLMSVAPDGSNARTLYSSIYEVFPQAWSPDGLYLLFVEPLSVGQAVDQKQQLSLLEVETGNVIWQISSTGLLTADWAPLPVAETGSQETIPPMAGKSGLLFVSTDYALAFYDPASGGVQKLTPPFAGREFSLSPDGQTVLFGDLIVSLHSQADGTVAASTLSTTNPRQYASLNWSPDGRKYGYADEAGRIWMVDLLGNRTELAEGDLPPDWSPDGRWLAFCDKQGHVWIAENGKPADWIVQQDHCLVKWSPAQDTLAYTTFPARDFTNRANGTAFLYDPVSGRTLEVSRNVSEASWSPDGKLVNIQRLNPAGPGSDGYSLSAVNPETGQELLIEDFNAETIGNRGWIEQTNGYLAGKYRFQLDLLAREQLADILFDARPDGDRLLVGSNTDGSVQVSCRDVEANAEYPIAEISLQGQPGVDARFSPDGEWVLVTSTGTGKTTDWLAHCGLGSPATFETLAPGTLQYFSSDSQWLVMEQTDANGENASRIFIQELTGGQVRQVPAGLHTSSAWFQMPAAPLVLASPSPEAATALPGVPTAESSGPVNLQTGTSQGLDSVMMLSILLWAGALIAILALVLYLWRHSSAARQTAKAPVPVAPSEDQPLPDPPVSARLSPEEVGAALRTGSELVRSGNAGEGIAMLSKVISTDPENSVAWFWLGIAAARQKDDRSAERCFLQAKRHGHPEADRALAWLRNRRK